jgi:GH15 family glucan-1,4-alpha-glucosidase
MDRQIESNGEQLGNIPQAFTKPALISAAIHLDRQLGGASVAWR